MTIRKILIILLCLVFLMGLGTVISIHLYYSSRLPRVPNEQDGHIYRMVVNHGFIVYGTEQEYRFLGIAEKTLALSCICGLIAGILNFKYEDFK
jgi:hypothetical protein